MSDDAASKIIEGAIRDASDGGAYDDERHQRRLRAMRSLGDIERQERRANIYAGVAVVLAIVAAFGLAFL